VPGLQLDDQAEVARRAADLFELRVGDAYARPCVDQKQLPFQRRQPRRTFGQHWIERWPHSELFGAITSQLKPGDTIRTGRNGRVLLVRGEETILVAPNSVIGLPRRRRTGLATTILQQAGSILLEVEKQNVKHFEVETPYLAAVVKGTQFSVTVDRERTSVSVLRGQVEVSDFKSGQIAQGHAGPGRHHLGARQTRIVPERVRHAQSDRTRQAASLVDRARPGAQGRAHRSAEAGRRQDDPRARSRRQARRDIGKCIPSQGTIGRRCAGETERHPDLRRAWRSQAEHQEGDPWSCPRVGSVRQFAERLVEGFPPIWSDAKAGSASSVAQGSSNSSSNGNGGGVGTSTGSAAATSAVAATVATVTAAASDLGLGNGATGNGNGNGNGGIGNLRGHGNLKH
jgi:FecR protein